MRRLILARTILLGVGVVAWGYGYRVDDPRIRLAAILILAVALLLRFVPKRWTAGDPEEPQDRTP
jgi:hypothetical protein